MRPAISQASVCPLMGDLALRRQLALNSAEIGNVEWPFPRRRLQRSKNSTAVAKKCCASIGCTCIGPVGPALCEFRQGAANGMRSRTGHRCTARRRSRKSPFCEFGFPAARARSTENAASAKSSALPRGGRTGHSCKTQQDQFGDLTDCGTKRHFAAAISMVAYEHQTNDENANLIVCAMTSLATPSRCIRMAPPFCASQNSAAALDDISTLHSPFAFA